MNLYEGIKNSLNEMGSFSSRMDTLRSANDRRTVYKDNVASQKMRKIDDLFSRLSEIQDDVGELGEIANTIGLDKLKQWGIRIYGGPRICYEFDDPSLRNSNVDLNVYSDKITMSSFQTSEHELTPDKLKADLSDWDTTRFIKGATALLDIYPKYVEEVNRLIDDFDLKYPEIQESSKLKEAGKALGRGLEDLISTAEDVDGLDKVIGTDNTSLNSREGYKEIYGEDASYTDIRKIVEELEAINEQAVEDGFNFTDKFATIITDLSSICADIEDFYEHR